MYSDIVNDVIMVYGDIVNDGIMVYGDIVNDGILVYSDIVNDAILMYGDGDRVNDDNSGNDRAIISTLMISMSKNEIYRRFCR